MAMLKEILRDIQAASTIMNLQQEMEFMDRIGHISNDELLSDFESLAGILDRLQESHTGGGIFEVTDADHVHFKEFANRLRRLGDKSESPKIADSLRAFADDLEVRFPASAEE